MSLFAKPERLTASLWAEKYRRLSREASSHGGGFFSFDQAPWQREVLDQPDHPDVGMIALMWASQVTGKTETVNNIIGYKIDIDACPILVVQYSIEMAETWSKDRLSTMLRDTPRLRLKVASPRVRDSGNTILHKRFPGGHLTVAGANSAASLASRPVRLVICDEIDRYPQSAGTEGDPVALAEKRTESFPDAAIVLVSTPGIEGVSRIAKAYALSDKRMWFCPCPKCGIQQTLKWDQVAWDKDDKGNWIQGTERYVCEHNKCIWTDEMRQQAVRAGEWRATAPFINGVRGYHLNGIYTLFSPKKPHKTRLAQMVSDFIKANSGGEQTLKVWINTFLAETWKIKGESVEVSDLMSRCEGYPLHLPEKVLCLVFGADVQADRIEATLFGCGEGNELWALEHQIFMGNTDAAPVWEAFDQWTLKEYDHPAGSKLRVACGLVDMGFRPKQVIKFTKARQGRRIYACAGSKTPWVPLVARPKKSTIRQATKFDIGGDTAKEVLYDRLKVAKPGPRFVHFPIGRGFDEEYFRQLAAETLVTELDERGIEKKKSWVKQRSRNEALDIFVYALGAIDVLNPNMKALAKSLAIKPPESISDTNAERPIESPERPQETTPAQPSTKRVFPVRRSGGNWVNGWRR